MPQPIPLLNTDSWSRAEAERGMIYLSQLPATIPAGYVLVHNLRPGRRRGAPGSRISAASGFRAWLSAPDPKRWEPCSCGWAPEAGQHFRPVARPE